MSRKIWSNSPSHIRLLLSVGLSFVISFGAGCGDKRTAEEHLREAARLSQAGDNRGALIELRNAAKKAPQNAEARWRLGEAYLQAGDAASATKEMTRALELGIQQADAGRSLAEALISQGRFDEALTRLPDDNATENADVEVLRGRALAGLGRKDEAIAAFERAYELDPQSTEALRGLAAIALTAGEVQRATGYLDRGLSIAPNDPQLLYLKGEIGLSSGDIASAMTAFEKAQLDPETELIALLGQARGQLASGDPDTARSITSRVLEQSPNHPLANYLFGLAEFQAEHYDGARSRLLPAR